MSLIRYSLPGLTSRVSRSPWTSLVADVDRLFNFAYPPTAPARPAGWQPPLDLWEQPEHYVVRLELPGVSKDAVELSFHDGVLTVIGERPQAGASQPGTSFHSERSYGRFTRSVTLPAQVNGAAITASFKDGVLSVTLPKAEEAKPRQIPVSVE